MRLHALPALGVPLDRARAVRLRKPAERLEVRRDVAEEDRGRERVLDPRVPDVEAHERARRVLAHAERLVAALDRVHDDRERVQLRARARERDDALERERRRPELLCEAGLAAQARDLEVRAHLGEVREVVVVEDGGLWELDLEPVEIREGAEVREREMLELDVPCARRGAHELVEASSTRGIDTH